MGIILGLCGWPGAGKSEVRKILVKDYGFEDINSKSVLYGLASTFTGLSEDHFYDPALKNLLYHGVTHRKIAGEIGKAIEGMFGEGFLIKEAMKNHKVAERPNKNFVIDSLRMTQPMLFNDKLTVVEVYNKRILAPTNDFDKYVMPIDKAYTMVNNTTLEALREEAKYLLDRITNGPF